VLATLILGFKITILMYLGVRKDSSAMSYDYKNVRLNSNMGQDDPHENYAVSFIAGKMTARLGRG